MENNSYQNQELNQNDKRVIELRKIERSIKREFKQIHNIPSVRLRSKSSMQEEIDPVSSIDKWDKIRREDSRFDQSQFEGGREKFYQK